MALASAFKVSQAIQVFWPLKQSFVSKPIVVLKNTSVHSPAGPWACLANRYLGSSGDTKAKPGPESAEKLKKKGLKSPQITLIMPDEHVTNDILENAEKMAKRRDLKLVKILDLDTKSQKPLYRLMSNLEYIQETKKAREEKKKKRNDQKSDLKDEKLFILSSKISDHDLSIKINQMQKLAKKKHPIRVFVSQDGNPTKAEEIVKVIEEELKVLAEKKSQIRKATTLKVQFAPKNQQDEIDSSEKKGIKKIDEVQKKKAGKTEN